jgi:glycosyltransferase involved in cell wall biosynthesis
MRSVRVPGASRILRHDYPVNWAIWRALFRLHPDCVIVSGWSTFAAQAAIAWCRLRGVPYFLVVESHDRNPRPNWRRRVKGAVVPRVVRGAAGILVTGTLARESMLARGADPERIRIFANTVDVADFGERADRLSTRRPELREALGLSPDDIAVLSVARLASEKGLDTLLRAVDRAADPRIAVLVAGEGPERGSLERLAAQLGVRLTLLGDLEWERIVEAYASADMFVLLSTSEPWGVVVNEAAGCGLPLILSDAVGAAYDLLVDGENGRMVSAGDVEAASTAVAELAASPTTRAKWGSASRRIAADWDYDSSVRGLLELLEMERGRNGTMGGSA